VEQELLELQTLEVEVAVAVMVVAPVVQAVVVS
jgi:hypothetical protein